MNTHSAFWTFIRSVRHNRREANQPLNEKRFGSGFLPNRLGEKPH